MRKQVPQKITPISDYHQSFTNATVVSDDVIADYHEQARLSYYNPFKNNDLSKARMYWSSSGEVWGRVLILLGFLLNIGVSFFFGYSFLTHILEQLNVTSVLGAFHLSVVGGATTLMVVIATVFMILFYLPMLICKTSAYVHGWAVAYIVIAISFFVVMEIFFSAALALSKTVAIFQNQINISYTIYFILVTFLITIFWLIGACILLVKSDDIRRGVHVE